MYFFRALYIQAQCSTVLLEIDKYVIEKVKEKRIEKGMSQSQLSFELGHASPGFVAMIETKKYKKKYNVGQINEIAKILECSVWDLLPENPL
jgi:transcriptional regulator with XRE-family HTH domain